MHVLFEGVVIYETRLVLRSLFANGAKQLNRVLEDFPYGYKHRECRSNIMPQHIFEDDTMTLKQSSSSMIVLIRFLPVFLMRNLTPMLIILTLNSLLSFVNKSKLFWLLLLVLKLYKC